MANIPFNPPVTFIDNPHAPEIFADSATGVFLFNGNIRITFESMRIDHSTSPGPANRVVIGRLVMSVPAAQAMIQMLQDFLKSQSQMANAPTQTQGPTTIQ